jgi:uncharacterized membrane protein
MENLPQQPGRFARFTGILKALLVFAAGLVILGWLSFTPPGLLGKADAAGYAVCHRIESRSFFIGDRQTPLCARCSGMYLGALLGMAYLARSGRQAGLPSLKVSLVLGSFLLAFGLDGINSYLQFFPGFLGLYEPHNWLRLITGTGLGLGIAAILVPVINQSLWSTYDNRAALAGWRELLPLLGMAAILVLALLSGLPLLLYPLALLSGVSILLILSLVYGVVWIMIAKQENRYQRFRDAWVPMLAGVVTAVLQIALFDLGRYWLTGTWSGFNL